MSKKIDIKKKNSFFLLLIMIAGTMLFYSLFQIINWKKDNDQIQKEMEQIKKETIIKEVSSEEAENTTSRQEDSTTLEDDSENKKTTFDPYWDFMKYNYLEVDFSNLAKMNSEVVAWLSVNGTNINYPVVQHKDNEYYLNHTFNGSKNNAGWVFLDYRNQINTWEKNTIIYAHGRQNGSMFGSLKNILKESWYQQKENHIIRLSTPNQNSLWQVFSVYRIPTTNDYIQTSFSSNTSFQTFLEKMKNRSIYDFQVELNQEDTVLTLSTCYDDNDKVVLHAKYIKGQER